MSQSFAPAAVDFDVEAIRAQFPILSRDIHGKPLVYLDNAASAQKPRAVIDAMRSAMEGGYANVHRGLHTLANETTSAFEAARAALRQCIVNGRNRFHERRHRRHEPRRLCTWRE